MKVKILVGASAAYACITGEGYSMDWRLNPGRSASTSLRESAQELYAKAARLMTNAAKLEAAAELLEKGA